MLGRFTSPLAIAFLLLLTFDGPAAQAADRAWPIAEPVPEAVYPLPGTLRTKLWNQLIWDGRSRRLTRQTLSLADPLAETVLDLHWEGQRLPREDGTNTEIRDDPLITGAGVLTWRRPGAPRYGRENIVAQYQGLLRNGRFEGEGKWIHDSGTYYEGQWQNGLMHGLGQLLLPDGTAYSGQFENGKFNGDGLLIDAAGNVHDGRFVDGIADGFGQVALETGETFSAVFRAGAPIASSRKPALPDWRFQRAKDTAAGGSTDLAITVNVTEKMPVCCDIGPPTLAYRAISTPEYLQILPNNPKLMDIWYGKRNIVIGGPQSESPSYTFEYDRAGVDEYSLLNYTSKHVVPLRLNVGLRNNSNANVRVVGAYLDMEQSRLDARPALQAIESTPFAATSLEYSIENYGWSKAHSMVLEFKFKGPDGKLSETQRLNIESVDKFVQFSFANILKKFGSNISDINESGNSCRDMSCVRQIAARGIYGKLKEYLVKSDDSLSGFGVNIYGSLHFSWRDAESKTVKSMSPFATLLRFGRLVEGTECEGGEFRPPASFEPITLIPDGGVRHISVDIEGLVKSGKLERWRIEFQSKKSSTHVFKIVFKLSDGSEIRSRRLKINLFKPRNYAGNFPQNVFRFRGPC